MDLLIIHDPPGIDIIEGIFEMVNTVIIVSIIIPGKHSNKDCDKTQQFVPGVTKKFFIPEGFNREYFENQYKKEEKKSDQA